MGNRDPIMAPHNCFRCAGQEEWVAIACATDAEWQSLCRVIGQEQLLSDERFRTANARKINEDELERIVTAWTSTLEKWEIAHRLQAAGIAAYPTLSSKGLLEDPQLNARDFFVRLPHAEVGTQAHAGMPWRFTHAPNGVRAPAPLLGQDTDNVLRDLLGYSTEEIMQMKSDKVLY
jgi:crotonobetainyl-CoA:carnitine CoA-transferase CaiB-like acyl-CoA transferase